MGGGHKKDEPTSKNREKIKKVFLLFSTATTTKLILSLCCQPFHSFYPGLVFETHKEIEMNKTPRKIYVYVIQYKKNFRFYGLGGTLWG